MSYERDHNHVYVQLAIQKLAKLDEMILKFKEYDDASI